jgi:signal peptidase I
MTIPFTLNPMIVGAGILTGLVVGGIVLLRSLFLFVTVSGRSMVPTLQPHDHVLVLRVCVAKKIKKGAIVLLDASAAQHLPPSAARHFLSSHASFIKRVVAVTGETYIDPGTSVPLRSGDKPYPLQETKHWYIPSGMVFVCGDNLTASSDSRIWGPVPLNVIQGVVIHHFKKQSGPMLALHPIPSKSHERGAARHAHGFCSEWGGAPESRQAREETCKRKGLAP